MNQLIIRASVAAAVLAVAGMASAQTDPSKVVAPSGEASTMVNGKPNAAKKVDNGMTRDAAKADAKMAADPTQKNTTTATKGEASTTGPNGQPNVAMSTSGSSTTKMERKEQRAAGSTNSMEKKANARDPKAATPQ